MRINPLKTRFSNLERKWNHFFNLLDADKNRFVEVADFIAIADRLADCRGLSERSGWRFEYKRRARILYDSLVSEMPRQVGRDGRINFMDFKEFLEDNVVLRREPFRRFIGWVLRHIFEIFDVDRNGVISYDELRQIFTVFDLDINDAVKSFEELDLNGDGEISKVEWLIGVENFFVSTKPGYGDFVFGNCYTKKRKRNSEKVKVYA